MGSRLLGSKVGVSVPDMVSLVAGKHVSGGVTGVHAIVKRQHLFLSLIH